jgi:hypothetical protein
MKNRATDVIAGREIVISSILAANGVTKPGRGIDEAGVSITPTAGIIL